MRTGIGKDTSRALVPLTAGRRQNGTRPRSAFLAQLALQGPAFSASSPERDVKRRNAARAYEQARTRTRVEPARFLVSA